MCGLLGTKSLNEQTQTGRASTANAALILHKQGCVVYAFRKGAAMEGKKMIRMLGYYSISSDLN